MQTTTSHETKLFDIVGKTEMLVGFNVKTTHYPMAVEEGHGFHQINEDETEIELTSVEIVIPGGMAVDILPNLTAKQKENIINELDY